MQFFIFRKFYLSVQFIIYKEMKERFSNHLWLDVLSKCDLLQESPVVFVTEDVNSDDCELAKYRKKGPDGALHVSVKSEVGLDEVIPGYLFDTNSLVDFSLISLKDQEGAANTKLKLICLYIK